MRMPLHLTTARPRSLFVLALALFGLLVSAPSAAQGVCERNLSADVVAFDMPLMWNRLGAQNINGMIYALRRDTVVLNDVPDPSDASLPPLYAANTPLNLIPDGALGDLAGNVTLRPDKRPRPLVLRTAEGDCLAITLTNLLTPVANPFNAPEERSGIPFEIENNDQVAGRKISLRFQGAELVDDISDDGSNVGVNGSSLVDVGASDTFTIYTGQDGSFVGRSYGHTFGGEGLGGTDASGLWAVLNVNPRDAAFYRSQLTNEEMLLAADANDNGALDAGEMTAQGHPIVDYEKRYPMTEPWLSEGKAGLPVINMVTATGELVHSDINAIVAYGPNFVLATPPDGGYAGFLGHFPASTYPLESVGKRNPTVPNRLEPFREFTIAFHDEVQTKQVFPAWFEDQVFGHTLHGVRDSFMVNYGSGGIGAEIIANRLGVGPMHDCANCAYEEFFLTAFTVGDVGMLTDIPANFGLENCDPSLNNCEAVGPKANFALYPDDPSNVHHSYTGDATAFRNVHAGPGEQHVFHLHNHQWLFNANDDNSNYLDAQGLGPGSGYAYWVNFGGSGNRNKTAGDAIFHCHFYPHFAQGMWEMWRIHDTFEAGTELVAQQTRVPFTDDGLGIGNGTPAPGARALPDGEIVAGTPIPAVVPLPGKPMAPMPAAGVTVKPNPHQVAKVDPATGLPELDGMGNPVLVPTGSLADVPDRTQNPGYPFWIAGMEHTVGQRPTTPPLDMITSAQAAALQGSGGPLWQHPGLADTDAIDGWDGGLPRFTLEGYAAGAHTKQAQTRLDFSKEIEEARPVFFPEEGTDLEQVAMAYHAQRCHDTFRPDGTAAMCAGDDVTGDGLPDTGGFILNGALPVPGAPFQEPCIDDQGRLLAEGVTGSFFDGTLAPIWDPSAMTVQGASPHNASDPRYYKAANVQFDAVFNKLGYHFPQQRIITLWQDVVPTIDQQRPPEPFVLRANTFDCTQYVHSNVVPKTYELDDYQVRTPTDIIGQHIHLPKWDLVSADGAANGWNYEDGTLAPQMVVEIITAINAYVAAHPADAGTLLSYAANTGREGEDVIASDGRNVTQTGSLAAADHPFFGTTAFADRWLGARSTMQRWFSDPVVNVQGVDRGLGIIFTHDHYGPSTHQQVGLYATLLIEPAGSKWVHNEAGEQLNLSPDGTSPSGRIDGGPTSWQAAILTGADGFGSDYTQNVGAELVENHREFYVEYSDFQHAYQPGVFVGIGPDGLPISAHDIENPWDDQAVVNLPGVIGAASIRETFRDAIQPSFRQQASLKNGFPLDIWEFPPFCPGDVQDGGTANVLRPCAEAITADDPGMYVVNYRNESLAARIFDPNRPGPDANGNDCSGPDRTGCGTQAAGKAGDLAFAMDSNTNRAIPALNDKLGLAPAGYAGGTCGGGIFCPPITSQGALVGGDPFTPTMRAFDGDRVHVKMQAGGQEEEHTAMLHGLKWLQGGSGFGTSKNSGWRNAQAAGISEQFTLRTPVFADHNQRGNLADYAYSFNASLDGWVTGTWGILRSHGNNQNDLFALPTNDPSKDFRIANAKDFDRVCPKDAPARSYDITAVQANDALPANADVTIQDLFPGAHVGASPDPNGGTLVYNPRTTAVAATAEARGGSGPLHDPTAILYFETADLVAVESVSGREVKQVGKDVFAFDADGNQFAVDWTQVDDRCFTVENGGKIKYHPFRSDCPVKVASGVPIEPLVLRSNAGDCLDVTLRNKVLAPAVTTVGGHRVYRSADTNSPAFFDTPGGTFYADTNGDGVFEVIAAADISWDQTLDLATGNAIIGMVRRDPGAGAQGMTTFQSNLMQPSAHVGLHPQLVEYDVTRSDGTNVGRNPGQQTAAPGTMETYQWYAGHIEAHPAASGPASKRNVELLATPIEFGGFNLMPADTIEQGQKAAIAAGAVYPEGSGWTVDAGTNTAASVGPDTDGDGVENALAFRDFTTVAQKGASMFYADTYPVHNLLGEGDFGVAEDAQDMGQMAINYGNEALWFRFGINPTDDHAMSDEPNAHLAYANALVGGDPETGVFTVQAGDPFRMHVLMPFAAGRGSTYDLHGHVWQRDPYVCEGSADLNLPGKCDMGNGHAGVNGTGEVGSRNLGRNPVGFWLGGIESWFAGEHYEIVIPSAGGNFQVAGDYLYRDHMGLGNAAGLWGIVRVSPAP